MEFQKNYAALGVPPARTVETQQLMSCPKDDAGETPALPVEEVSGEPVPRLRRSSLRTETLVRPPSAYERVRRLILLQTEIGLRPTGSAGVPPAKPIKMHGLMSCQNTMRAGRPMPLTFLVSITADHNLLDSALGWIRWERTAA